MSPTNALDTITPRRVPLILEPGDGGGFQGTDQLPLKAFGDSIVADHLQRLGLRPQLRRRGLEAIGLRDGVGDLHADGWRG